MQKSTHPGWGLLPAVSAANGVYVGGLESIFSPSGWSRWFWLKPQPRTQIVSADLKSGLHQEIPPLPFPRALGPRSFFFSPFCFTFRNPSPAHYLHTSSRDLQGEQAPLIGGWLFKEFTGENFRPGCEQNLLPSGFSLVKKTTHTGLPTSNQKIAAASPGWVLATRGGAELCICK